MKKQAYQKPEAQLVRFENEDVITTSGDCPNGNHHLQKHCNSAAQKSEGAATGQYSSWQ